METREPVHFDIDTVLMLREILDDAWTSLPPQQRTTSSKTLLAQRILKSAAEGERDTKRLFEAALMPMAA
jgi:hypothetical protein